MSIEFYIKQVTWSTHEQALRLIRQQVFIVEQRVPETLEWDEHDSDADHLLVFNHQHKPIACLRLLGGGSIGRMAVMKEWRHQGIGKALLADAITFYKHRDCQVITLSAQEHAIAFYEQAGFVINSKPYLDANILHVDMKLNI